MPDPNDVPVKICGLTETAGLQAAVEGGARYIGFNFFPPSPRYVDPDVAAKLCNQIPPGVCKVALVVNADDDTLAALVDRVPVDMLQLHGAEPSARVAEIKAQFGLPVMKAVGVSDASDLETLYTYARVADQLLVDAKPPKGAELPGGNGVAFDWQLLSGTVIPVPWLLAGGLTPDNVAQAIRLTGARQVDVASGVERPKGVKDPGLIRAFLAAARSPAPALH